MIAAALELIETILCTYPAENNAYSQWELSTIPDGNEYQQFLLKEEERVKKEGREVTKRDEKNQFVDIAMHIVLEIVLPGSLFTHSIISPSNKSKVSLIATAFTILGNIVLHFPSFFTSFTFQHFTTGNLPSPFPFLPPPSSRILIPPPPSPSPSLPNKEQCREILDKFTENLRSEDPLLKGNTIYFFSTLIRYYLIYSHQVFIFPLPLLYFFLLSIFPPLFRFYSLLCIPPLSLSLPLSSSSLYVISRL